MDELRFDNIGRRLGGLRSRRDALKIAGSGAAAVFTALGLENSALAGQVTTQNHCRAYGVGCTKARQCCGWKRHNKEVRCGASNAGPGSLCCGKTKASCFDDADCCVNFICNSVQQCARV